MRHFVLMQSASINDSYIVGCLSVDYDDVSVGGADGAGGAGGARSDGATRRIEIDEACFGAKGKRPELK